MVIDDLQWADHESLIVWDQLAASVDQLPLLLIATCQSHPRRPEVRQLRAAVIRRGGEMIALGQMAEADVATLVTTMVGSPPGDTLRQLTAQASGNPLYLRELLDALVRERTLEIGAAAELAPAGEHIPASLAAVLSDRLSFVSARTAEMLRTAVLFGGTFAVTDLAVLLHSPASKLAVGLEEAVAAGILVSSGPELAFRHPLIQQALYESMPGALRTALHAEAARELATTRASEAEAALETQPARAAAASWQCRGLLEADPAPLREAVAHYRQVGPAGQLPTVLEDLAMALAGHGEEDEARATLNEAIGLYEGLQARWDIRRAEGRLRSYGIRRGVRGPRPQRAAFGWDALTPTEMKIATLVAEGNSTSDIAKSLFLSRRTVQTHISHILTKLGAKRRAEIVREALRQGNPA